MRAIILAAGRGRRMGELTDDRPKCLLPFRGRELLDWQLTALQAAGIGEVAIVTGYRRELIASRASIEFYNPRWGETNMVRSLQTAHAWLEAGPCLICYADLYYEPSGPEALIRTQAPLVIAYDPNWLQLWSRRFADPLSDAETFHLTDDGVLKEIGGRPSHVDEVQGQYMGLLRIEPAGWTAMMRSISTLPAPQADRLQMTQLLQLVIDAGAMQVRAIPYSGKWVEYDSVSDIA